MAKLRSVSTSFWSDPFIEDLTAQEKLLYLYLITNEKTNMLGVYEVSFKKISFETGLDKATVQNALEGFERIGKVKYIETYVILVNFMKHQNFNTNMMKSAIDVYNSLPQILKIKGVTVNKDNPLEGFERLSKGLVMVPKVEVEVLEAKYIKEDNIMATPETNSSSLKTPKETFELFWNHWFTFVKHKKEKKEPTFKKWKALSIEDQRKAYVQSEPYSQTKEPGDHKFLCIARTYLNDKLFNDEMTPDSKIEEPKDNRILYHGTPKLLNATEEYVANHLSHDQLLGGKPIINQNKYPEYNGLYYNFKSRTFHKEIQAELYVLEPWKNTITT